MSKQQNLVLEGKVLQELGNSLFKVELDNSNANIICTISGKIRKNYIRIMAGDNVRVEVSPYDLTKGRIVSRLRQDAEIVVSNNINNKNKKKK